MSGSRESVLMGSWCVMQRLEESLHCLTHHVYIHRDGLHCRSHWLAVSLAFYRVLLSDHLQTHYVPTVNCRLLSQPDLRSWFRTNRKWLSCPGNDLLAPSLCCSVSSLDTQWGRVCMWSVSNSVADVMVTNRMTVFPSSPSVTLETTTVCACVCVARGGCCWGSRERLKEFESALDSRQIQTYREKNSPIKHLFSRNLLSNKDIEWLIHIAVTVILQTNGM